MTSPTAPVTASSATLRTLQIDGMTGDAFELENWSPLLYESDLAHPSPRGSFLAGLVMYTQIFQEPVGPLNYLPLAFSMGVSPALARRHERWAS